MRVVLQRVTGASVTVAGERVAAIGGGYLALVGVGHGDGPQQAERLAEKISTLRIFADDVGKMNLALADVEGEVLVVSQFTLYADLHKGPAPRGPTQPIPARPRCSWMSWLPVSNGVGSPSREACSAPTCRSSS